MDFNKAFKLFMLTISPLFLSGELAAEVVYTNSLEGLSLGIHDDDSIEDNWNSRYALGPDEGRVSIVTDSYNGKALRVLYPQWSNASKASGATWETDIGRSADALYMSYWVKVDYDFQFIKGGKLPGLAGSTTFPHGDNEFSTRLMWREDGKLEFYLHGYNIDNTADYNGDINNAGEPYRVFWDDAGYHAQLIPEQWHHIEIYQKLNTPGQRDGRLMGWLDGKLVCDNFDNSGVRAKGETQTQINHLFFSTFFGGSSAPVTQWQPTQDVYVNFDEFVVSTTRIGVDGNITPDDDSSSSPDDTTDDSGSTDPEDNCLTYTFDSGLKELSFLNSSGGCIEIIGGNLQSSPRTAIADSDLNGVTCNLRGHVTGSEGGSHVIDGNWETPTTLSGNILYIDVSNDCPNFKLRVLED